MTERTRFEAIVQDLTDSSNQIAISAAVFFAREHKEEFTRKYGTHGWECLERLFTRPKA